jgi:hypothetical protein
MSQLLKLFDFMVTCSHWATSALKFPLVAKAKDGEFDDVEDYFHPPVFEEGDVSLCSLLFIPLLIYVILFGFFDTTDDVV